MRLKSWVFQIEHFTEKLKSIIFRNEKGVRTLTIHVISD